MQGGSGLQSLREWGAREEGGGAIPLSLRNRIHLKMSQVSHTMRRNICRAVVGMSWPQSQLSHFEPTAGGGEVPGDTQGKGPL